MASEGQADKYEVLEKIGQGSFGVIRKVKRTQDGMVSFNQFKRRCARCVKMSRLPRPCCSILVWPGDIFIATTHGN